MSAPTLAASTSGNGTAEGQGYAFDSVRTRLIEARLAYIRRHGARFLFYNEPLPAPGWPRLRGGKMVFTK